MLQRAYDGDWVDGVKFLYEGKPIEFEHVAGLSGAHYRTVDVSMRLRGFSSILWAESEYHNETEFVEFIN